MIIHDPTCLLHDVPFEFNGEGLRPYPESPERVNSILRAFADHDLVTETPRQFDRKWTKSVHSKEYVEFVDSIPASLTPVAPTSIRTAGEIRKDSSFYAKLGHYFFDPATPVMGSTPAAAKSAVDVALSTGKSLLEGADRSYALCRPPGHHARRSQGGGYCIFNNVAIVANYLTAKGKSVSILDLDYHHGNGTQEIFYSRDDVQYVSLHGDPTSNYPFYWGWADQRGSEDGLGFTVNHPLPSTASEQTYLQELQKAVLEVSDYSSDIVLVSMGFDCYIDDPIAGMSLTTDSYHKIGSALQGLDHVGVILEGGYHVGSIGDNMVQLYRGLES